MLLRIAALGVALALGSAAAAGDEPDPVSADGADAAGSATSERLQKLATEAGALRLRLSSVYPGHSDLWEPIVRDWEESALDALLDQETSGSSQQAVERRLEVLSGERDRRIASVPRLARRQRQASAGVLPQSVAITPRPRYRFEPEPPNGAVWIISRFRFEHCARTSGNGWDLDNCRWKRLAEGLEEALRGNDRLFARWPDGRELRAAYDLNHPPGRGTIPFRLRPD